MNRILFLFAATILLIGLADCKKTNNSNSTNPKVDAPFIYGTLTAFRQQESDTISTIVIEHATATFWSDSITNSPADPGIVTVMSDTLLTPSTGNYYAYNFSGRPLTWYVNGNYFVPEFSFTLTDSFPTYSGVIPDTIVIANGVSLDISAAKTNNCDSIRIAFPDMYKYFSYKTSQNTATISTSQISSFNSGFGNIFITTWKNNYAVFNGKKYKFVRISNVVKLVRFL